VRAERPAGRFLSASAYRRLIATQFDTLAGRERNRLSIRVSRGLSAAALRTQSADSVLPGAFVSRSAHVA